MPAVVCRKHSLRTQITVAFGSFSALLAFLLCLLAGEWLKSRLEQQAGASLHVLAHNTSTVLHKDIAQQRRAAQAMASARELWEYGLDSQNVKDMLDRLQYIHPQNVWIGVTDAQGTVKSATKDLLAGVDVSQRPWFQQALQAPFISEVHPAKLLEPLLPPQNNGEPLRLIDFSAPIHNPQGQLLGVLGIHASWDWVRESVEGLVQGAIGRDQKSVFIFDRKGELIYAPDGVMAPYTNLGQALPKEIDQSNSQPVIATWQDSNNPFLTAAVRLPPPSAEHDLGWWIVARQPIATAYAAANRVLWLAIGIGLVTGLLAIVVAWRLARHVSNDLKKLAQATSAEHAAIPLLDSSREVQQLSHSLDSMTRTLRSANEHMQEQVKLRTQQLEQANAELDRQANTDPLTQLLNRRGFEAHAQRLLALAERSQRPLSAMTLDIDFFKRVNDQYGHDVGDVVLQALATLLRQRMRITDVTARFGGEEFVVLLPDTDAPTAQQIANELLQNIASTPIPPVGNITVSIGVSGLRADHDNLHDMLKRSDEALYQAKQTGRNRSCVAL